MVTAIHSRVALPALLAAFCAWGGAARGAPPPTPAPRRAPASKGPVLPAEESLAERRAVRGSPVDDAPAGESPELRDLRRFEEQAFPRAGAPVPVPGDDTTPPAMPLPGHWGGSGDVAPELRSPSSPPSSRSPSASTPPSPAPDSDWLRSLKLPDLPVRWDPLVLRYLDYFKSDPRGRAVMGNWLRHAGRFRATFEKTLARHGLPKDLVYLAMVESGFDTGARSRVGAGGVWQFMPGAARAYGLEVSYWLDARCDPERAADAAARYLKDLYVRFGSWHLVFAAYNAGYGAVLKSITAYNTNDFWELVRHESGLPWESSIYVPKILAAAIVGNNAQAFGFGDVTPDPAYAYEEVEVPPGTALQTIARAAGARVEVIQALNPQLIRDRTPPDRGAIRVRVPPGSAAQYASNLDKTHAGGDHTETIVLRFGETLDDVAKAHGLGVRDLRRLNGVKDSAELRAGVSILVPRRSSPMPKGKAQHGKDGDESETVAEKTGAGSAVKVGDGDGSADADEVVIVAVPDRSFSYEGRERVFYKTRDADTLDEIADAFGVRSEELTEWNNLDPSAKLHPRMVLQVFVRKDFDPVGVLLLDPAKVRVVTLGSQEFLELEAARRGKKRLTITAKPGETLAKLGRRYGLTPGDLARINRFSYNTELHEGQRIVVYSPTGDAPREVTMGLTPEPKRPKVSVGGAGTVPRVGSGPHKPAPAVPARATASKAPTARTASAREPARAAPPRPQAPKAGPASGPAPKKR
jgi:membrane-bound lytic murein transglycosylase D